MNVSPFVQSNSYLMVKDNVAAILREHILQGRLNSGDRIVEGKWAAKLGVAQASVREALNILGAEGFVQKGPGRCARVTQLSDEDVAQIYEVRASLEGLAARLVVQKKADLSGLEQILADMTAAAERQNMRAFYDRDLQFHMLVCHQSGNRFLEQDLRRLVVPLFAFVVMHGRGGLVLRESITQHRTIVDAIRSGDPFFAQNQMEHTLQRFSSATCGVLKKQGEINSALPDDQRSI
jgi:DNA-binding GntR family transcriptional regulator